LASIFGVNPVYSPNLYGTGVWGGTRGTFIKTGYIRDQNNGNVLRDDADNMLARRAHVVLVSENVRKGTTAGLGVNSSWNNGRASGGWDN